MPANGHAVIRGEECPLTESECFRYLATNTIASSRVRTKTALRYHTSAKRTIIVRAADGGHPPLAQSSRHAACSTAVAHLRRSLGVLFGDARAWTVVESCPPVHTLDVVVKEMEGGGSCDCDTILIGEPAIRAVCAMIDPRIVDESNTGGWGSRCVVGGGTPRCSLPVHDNLRGLRAPHDQPPS